MYRCILHTYAVGPSVCIWHPKADAHRKGRMICIISTTGHWLSMVFRQTQEPARVRVTTAIVTTVFDSTEDLYDLLHKNNGQMKLKKREWLWLSAHRWLARSRATRPSGYQSLTCHKQFIDRARDKTTTTKFWLYRTVTRDKDTPRNSYVEWCKAFSLGTKPTRNRTGATWIRVQGLDNYCALWTFWPSSATSGNVSSTFHPVDLFAIARFCWHSRFMGFLREISM